MDAFAPGILLTILGMGVVFSSLLVLMAVIHLLERALGTGRPQENAAQERTERPPEEEDLAIVLAAAAGHFLETEGAETRIPQVRRGQHSVWARTARLGRLGQRVRR